MEARQFYKTAAEVGDLIKLPNQQVQVLNGVLPERKPRQGMLFAAVVLIALGAWVLRIYRIDGQSLWYDEGTSAALAQRSIALITRDAAGDIHPPLYYYLLHFWSGATGASELALRLLSAIYGTITVLLTYKLGSRMIGKTASLAAAVFAASSPILVYYSQEARMYMQLTALAALSTYLMLRLTTATDRPRRLWIWAGYFVTTAGMLYTHYFAFTVLLTQNIFVLASWLLQRRASENGAPSRSVDNAMLAKWILAQTALLLAFVPWLIVARAQLIGWPSKSQGLGFDELLHNVLRAFAFGIGADASYTDRRALAILALLVVGLGFLCIRGRHVCGQGAGQPGRYERMLVVLLAVTPVLAMYVMSIQRPMYNPKFLLPATVGFFLLAGAGVAGVKDAGETLARLIRRPRVKTALSVFAIIAACAVVLYPAGNALSAYYFDPKYARDDYRGLVALVASQAGENDAIVLNAPGQIEIFAYYYHGPLPQIGLPRQRPIDEAQTEADLTEVASQQRRVWVVQWATSESDPSDFVERWLDAHGRKDLDQPFGTVRLLRYVTAGHEATSRVDTGSTLESVLRLSGKRM